MHAFDAVEAVKILRLYEMNIETGEQGSKAAGRQICSSPMRSSPPATTWSASPAERNSASALRVGSALARDDLQPPDRIEPAGMAHARAPVAATLMMVSCSAGIGTKPDE